MSPSPPEPRLPPPSRTALLGWELGDGLGHVQQLARLAGGLAAGGLRPVLAVKNLALAGAFLRDFPYPGHPPGAIRRRRAVPDGAARTGPLPGPAPPAAPRPAGVLPGRAPDAAAGRLLRLPERRRAVCGAAPGGVGPRGVSRDRLPA